MMNSFFLRHLVVFLICLSIFDSAQAQTPSQRGAVMVSASVQTSPVAIVLSWPAYSASGFDVYRRLPGATNWGSAIASLPGNATGYTDNAIAANVAYEYKVRKSASSTGYGYIRSGVEVPANEMHYRGKMILLVEDSLGMQLVSELNQLESDLLGDGWYPIRIDVSATESPVNIRNQIIATYNADPSNVKALYIIGHVPVAYSGNTRPDGHTQHRGAWACDGFYGELNGNWTDNSVNSSGAVTPWTHNVPGDGKFDQSDFNSNVELMVGRVHLGQLPAFGQSDVQLTQAYLNKAHAFKMRWWEPPATAVIHDNLSWVTNPLASSGYTSCAALVGAPNVLDVNVNAEPWSNYSNNPYLINYHSGSGAQSNYQNNTTFVGINGGGTTDEIVNNPNRTVFNMSFGSYFGDWDNYNNYLRALIANGDGLVSVWSGQPNWFLHPLAMGEPIGFCTRLAMNNTNSNYSQQNGGWWGQNYDRIHLALMGDPSIRMRMLAPPTQLVATNSSWYINLSWQPSPDAVSGYYVYRINDSNGEIELISGLISGTSFSSNSIQFFPGDRYMVRAAALQITASGSFENLSIGALAVASGTPIADCNGTVGGSDIPGNPCDDGNSATGDDTWDSGCQCIGLAIDCAGNPGGTAVPGTSCNDNNPNTGNDEWDANCNCVGVQIDCEGVTGGSALPGTPCDDGNSGSGNDTWDINCFCVGQIIDCEGTTGGIALPGTACDDGDANTLNDVWTSTCDCLGSPLSIDELQGATFELFPNPANDFVIVRTEGYFDGSLKVRDIAGKQAIITVFQGNELRVDLNALSAGAYMIELFNNQDELLSAQHLLVH